MATNFAKNLQKFVQESFGNRTNQVGQITRIELLREFLHLDMFEYWAQGVSGGYVALKSPHHLMVMTPEIFKDLGYSDYSSLANEGCVWLRQLSFLSSLCFKGFGTRPNSYNNGFALLYALLLRSYKTRKSNEYPQNEFDFKSDLVKAMQKNVSDLAVPAPTESEDWYEELEKLNKIAWKKINSLTFPDQIRKDLLAHFGLKILRGKLALIPRERVTPKILVDARDFARDQNPLKVFDSLVRR
jgi:hypothetical protein